MLVGKGTQKCDQRSRGRKMKEVRKGETVK